MIIYRHEKKTLDDLEEKYCDAIWPLVKGMQVLHVWQSDYEAFVIAKSLEKLVFIRAFWMPNVVEISIEQEIDFGNDW